MTVGVMGDDILVRILPEKMKIILQNPYCKNLVMGNKTMKEFVLVAPDGCHTEAKLHGFVELGLAHAKRKLGEANTVFTEENKQACA